MTIRAIERLLIGVAACWCVAGCVTIHSAHPAYPIDEQGHLSTQEATRSGLRISGEELTYLSSPNFGVLELTFENNSADWRRIKRVSLDFSGEANNQFVRIPWGDDIRAWYDATLQRNQINAINREIALGVVAIAGMVVASTSRSQPAKAMGGLAALSSVATMLAEHTRDAANSAEHVAIFPDSHLLALPFAVPPNLFTKKWVLLNTPGGNNVPCIDHLVLTYEFEDRPFERVFLQYKSDSEWQARACRKKSRESSDGL
jgi:hypothetical protein